MGKWVVTSAWPYINTVPHLGNLVGSILSADVFARFLRMMGHEVVFVSGSDEHGTPIEIEAIKKGISPKDLTDQAHEYVKKMWELWEISFDNYTRTETEIHKEFVQGIMKDIHDRGYFTVKPQIVPYCPKEGIYLPDRFVQGICPFCGFEEARGDQCDGCGRLLDPQDLIDPRCVFCGTRPYFKKRDHWFFRLDLLENEIIEWVSKNEKLDQNVRNFTVSWIRSTGLTPRAVTRDNRWGIPAPFPGASDKTIYVWFDALMGYVSATIEYFRDIGEPEKWREFWVNPDASTSYFIGKDNIPFHAVILPAMFMASGRGYNLPTLISATEYLMYEGSKFTKRKRIGIWVDEALKIVDDVDYWRYALIRMRPEDKDTNFKWSEFVRFVNNELNDHIGNYIHRVLTLIFKYFEGKVPEPEAFDDDDLEFASAIKNRWRRYVELMYKARLKAASEHIVALAEEGNRYLNRRAPWKAVKENRGEAAAILFNAFRCGAALVYMLKPLTPRSSQRFAEMMGIKNVEFSDDEPPRIDSGIRISKPSLVFRKLPKELVESLLDEGKREKLLAQVKEEVSKDRPEFLRF